MITINKIKCKKFDVEVNSDLVCEYYIMGGNTITTTDKNSCKNCKFG